MAPTCLDLPDAALGKAPAFQRASLESEEDEDCAGPEDIKLLLQQVWRGGLAIPAGTYHKASLVCICSRVWGVLATQAEAQ